MNTHLNRAIVIFYSHFLLYPFYFNFINNTVQQIVIFGFLMVYSFININQIKSLFGNMNKYKKEIITIITLYLTIGSSAFIIPFLHQTYDFSYLGNFIRTTLYLLSYIVLLTMIRNLYDDSNLKMKIIEIFVKVTRNYVLVTILFLAVPQIKNLWLNIINVTETHVSLINNPAYITRVGWVGYSGFTLTIFCAISVVFSIYLLVDYYKHNQTLNINYLIALFVSIVGNSFYGRSGLAISLLMVGFGVLYMGYYYKKYNLILAIFGSIILIFIGFSLLKDYNETFSSWYNWLMEPLINLRETGTLQTSSTNTLIEMWFLPDIETLFFGDGYYTDPITNSYYMDTDVGYLRPVLFHGLFMTILSYLIPVILGLTMLKNSRESNFLVFMLLTTMFIFEVKGEVFLGIIPIMLMLSITHSIDYNNSRIENKTV